MPHSSPHRPAPPAGPIPVEMNLESKTALEFLTTGEGTWAPGLPNFVIPRSSRACWPSASRRTPALPSRRRRAGRSAAVRLHERRARRRRGRRPDRHGRGRTVGAVMGERSQKKSEALAAARPKPRCSQARSSRSISLTASRQGGRGRVHGAIPHRRDCGARQRSRAHRQARRAGRGTQGRARARLGFRRFARQRRAQPEPVDRNVPRWWRASSKRPACPRTA